MSVNFTPALVLFGSAFIGGLVVIWIRSYAERSLRFLLSFSGAFLLGITVLHLLPEVYHHEKATQTGLFILVGFVLQLVLEFFSQGIEHGHVHHRNRLPSFPSGIMLSLCIHAFTEGIPIENHDHHFHHHHHESGNENDFSLLMGVVLHKIPVAMALVTLLLHSGMKKKHALLWLAVFAAMAPLGTFTGHWIAQSHIAQNTDIIAYILATVVGMFLHISTTILFESSDSHRFNLLKLLTVIIGGVLAWVAT